MPDPIFDLPRLAAIYDALDPDRSDLTVYADLAGRLGACRVLDVGCGTGTLALNLSGRCMEVTGVDPAAASLEVEVAGFVVEDVRGAPDRPGRELVFIARSDADLQG